MRFYSKLFIAFITSGAHIQLGQCTKDLHRAILDDIMPPTSEFCSSSDTTFTNVYSRERISEWYKPYRHFAEDVFLMEMKNGENNKDAQKWSIRVGQGGNIYSFVGAFGEAMPPQANVHSTDNKKEGAPFMDEVWQTVAVDTTQNNVAEGHSYFIHQAGTYLTDDLREPFWSRDVCISEDDRDLIEEELLDMHCEDNFCSFGSWGQQAHIPTTFTSPALYFNRYADCGNGVLEHTTVVHNMAGSHDDAFQYLNTPWAGVRTSALQYMTRSNSVGTGEDATSELLYPIPYFGSGDDDLVSFADTGGYTSFLQAGNNSSFEMPCGDNEVLNQTIDCSDPSAIQLRFQVRANATYEKDHTEAWGRDVFAMQIHNTVQLILGCSTCHLRLINKSTLEEISIAGVLHYSWSGYSFWFFADYDSILTAEDINEKFPIGSEMYLDHVQGIPYNESLGLSFVHGTSESLNEPMFAGQESRVRYGLAGNLEREFTVFTVNKLGMNITQGDTFVYRQYMIADKSEDMDQHASSWVNETFQEYYPDSDELEGREVKLFMDTSSQKFGASLLDEECHHTDYSCQGSTVPQSGLKPTFAIACKGGIYVGDDLYHFAETPDEDNNIRPYICEGRRNSKRKLPDYTLLGYFADGACQTILDAAPEYDPELCLIDQTSRGRKKTGL